MTIFAYSIGQNKAILLEIVSEVSGEKQSLYLKFNTITDEQGVIRDIDSITIIPFAFEFIYNSTKEKKIKKIDPASTKYLVKLLTLKVKQMSKEQKHKDNSAIQSGWNEDKLNSFLLLLKNYDSEQHNEDIKDNQNKTIVPESFNNYKKK